MFEISNVLIEIEFQQCMQMSFKKCRCGQRQKEVPCAKEFLCEKKCNNMRSCGVHKCNRKVTLFLHT